MDAVRFEFAQIRAIRVNYPLPEYAVPTGLAILRHWFYKDSAPDGAKDDECDSRQRFHPRRFPQPQLEGQGARAPGENGEMGALAMSVPRLATLLGILLCLTPPTTAADYSGIDPTTNGS